MELKEYLEQRGIDKEKIDEMDYYELMELSRDIETEKCRDDVCYYVRQYCVYEDKDAPELIQPFNMWPEQESALKSIHEHRLNVILKARQLGFSWLTMSYASWTMRMRSGRTVIGLSRSEDEAAELVRRLEVEFVNMPALIREKKESDGWNGPVYEKYTMKLVIHFPNEPDSVFYAFPSSPGSVRSFTADLVIFDEWAFQQFAEQIWVSAAPTINRPTGGKFIGLSTNERGSLFEKMFTDKDNGFNKIFIPWFADPRRDDEWYAKTKAMLGDKITQEYPATVEEALSVIGGAYFPEVTKATHYTKIPMKGITSRYVALDYGFDMLAVYWISVDANYNAQIYREIHEPNHTANEAADMVRSLSSGEHIVAYLAPPDLWNRQTSSGKSTAIVFHERGVELTKVDNDVFNGCMRMKEWLAVQKDGKALLTILEDCADNLYNSITKIQKDKNKPNVYAKTPHNLTHSVDALRYFCVYWILPPDISQDNKKNKWTDDMWEDYNNANAEDRQFLIEKWGEPR